MLERSEGLADITKQRIQEIQGNRPHVSGNHVISRPSLDISSIWASIIVVEVKKLQLSPV
jgi:hypothetical protein